MLQWMHNYRVPILVVVLLGLFGFGAWGAIQDLFKTDLRKELFATYTLPGGEEVRLTAGEVDDLLRSLSSVGYSATSVVDRFARTLGLADRQLDAVLVAWRVLHDAAVASGVHVPLDVIGERLRGQYGLEPGQALPESHIEIERFFLETMEFRNAYLSDPAGALFEPLYEEYKKQHAILSGRYALFPEKTADSFPIDVGSEDDREKLRTWFEERGQYLKSMHPVKENVDIEVAYVNFRDFDIAGFGKEFETRFAAHAEGMEVPEEEVRRRFDVFASQYQALLRKEQDRRRAEGLATEDQPDEYETLKPHLVRELKVARLLKRVMDEVAAGENEDFRSIAEGLGFRVAAVERKDQLGFMQIPEFGSVRAWQTIRGQAIDKLKAPESEEPGYVMGAIIPYVTASDVSMYPVFPDIFDEPGQFQALYRMTRHEAEREPAFEDIVGKVATAWQEARVREEVGERAKAFRDRIDSWIKENVDAVKTRYAELDEVRNESVAKEIAARELDREKEEHQEEIKSIEMRFDAERDSAIQPLLREHHAAAFGVVAQEMGVETGVIPRIVRSDTTGAPPPADAEFGREELFQRIVRNRMVADQLFFLEKGTVGYPLPQPALKSMMVLITDEKIDPPKDELLRYPVRAQVAARGLMAQGERDWKYETFQRPDFFNLHSKRIDEAKERDRRAEEARAARAAERAAERERELRRKDP